MILGLAFVVGCGRDEAPDGSQQAYDARGARIKPGPALENPPNIIVLVIDALRADAIAADGIPLPLAQQRMPFLASLAEQGVQFTQATASAPWTLPSMVSLFTGLRPSKHGQNRMEDQWHLPGAVTTLPEVLKTGYGYDTAAFVNGRWFQQSKASLLQGFTTREVAFSLQDMEGTVGRWNKRRDRARPFFLMLHTCDVHDPYGKANHPWPLGPKMPGPVDPALLEPGVDPGDIFRACFLELTAGVSLHSHMGSRLGDLLQWYKYKGYAEAPRPELARELEQAYWEGARWGDDLLASAHEKLERWGLLENTLLVVTADHGQAFGEHGNLAHTLCLYDEVIHVPLVMKGPGVFADAHVIDDSVALFDVLPTFLDWIGAAPLADIDARSFLQLLRGEHESWCRPVISEELLTRMSTGCDVNSIRVSVRSSAWKYLATIDRLRGEVHEEAYDLRLDPEERHDLGERTGTLPSGKLFDPCVCAVLEEMRRLIWQDDAQSDEVITTPYGAGQLRMRTPRPPPCDSEP
jgi:arylsulfatase A-like enzyme